MRRLRHADVYRERETPRRSALLFITDRCPVGCGHCSVGSLRTSPRISDFALFERIVDGLCVEPDRQVIGISGGEPFVERRGLTHAVRRLAAAGKDVIVYTSGVWAKEGDAQDEWITAILPLISCVYLSTDAFHANSVSATRFGAAARTVRDAGVPIVVQVLDLPDQLDAAGRLLEAALGSRWSDDAELVPIQPLPYGRGESLFAQPPLMDPAEIGPCRAVHSPVVRYDGRISACCNELVVMNRGPSRLSRTVTDADDVVGMLSDLAADPLLQSIATVGLGAVTTLPRFEPLASQPVRGGCDLCWRLQDSTPEPVGDRTDRVLAVLPVLAGGLR